MNRSNHKLYNNILDKYLAGNMNYFHRNRKHVGLTRNEKKLLEVRALMKLQQFTSAIDLLNPMNDTSIFMLAEKHFIIASAESYCMNYLKALKHNQLAFDYYKRIEDDRGCFLSLYNQSVDYGRINCPKENETCLKKALRFACTPTHHSLILRALACKYSNDKNYPKAYRYLEQILEKQNIFSSTDKISTLSVAADIYFRGGDWEKSLSILKKIKTLTNDRNREKTFFEYQLLKALINKGQLPKIPTSFEMSTSEYKKKWEMLYLLQKGKVEEAKKIWNSWAQCFPGIYKNNFEVVSEKENDSIYMTFLKKNIMSSTPRDESLNIRGKKANKLYKLLANSPLPLRKEEVIEQLWGTKYHPDYDSRLYKLVERLKASIPNKIINSNCSYQLV